MKCLSDLPLVRIFTFTSTAKMAVVLSLTSLAPADAFLPPRPLGHLRAFVLKSVPYVGYLQKVTLF